MNLALHAAGQPEVVDQVEALFQLPLLMAYMSCADTSTVRKEKKKRKLRNRYNFPAPGFTDRVLGSVFRISVLVVTTSYKKFIQTPNGTRNG